MSRTRAGRKAQETHRNFLRTVKDFAQALAEKSWKFSVEETKAMIIERTEKVTGKTEVITCNQAIGEIMNWEGRMNRNSFSNISGDGISDMLCDTFFQGAVVHTGKASYTLWVKPEPKAAIVVEPAPETEPKRDGSETLHICLNDRLHEFRDAAARAADSEMGIFADWDKDTFAVNIDSKTEYEVVLQTRQNRVFASCGCSEFSRRNRVCKHVTEVLKECFAPHFAELEATLEAETEREAWAYLNEVL